MRQAREITEMSIRGFFREAFSKRVVFIRLVVAVCAASIGWECGKLVYAQGFDECELPSGGVQSAATPPVKSALASGGAVGEGTGGFSSIR